MVVSMKRIILLWVLPLTTLAADYCEKVAEQVESNRGLIPAYMSGYKVVGEGRLYFYSAPDQKCKLKNIFIIPGDKVDALADYEDYTFVVYTTAKGKDVEGWVESGRLKETGTGIGPAPDQQ